jgi:adenylate kinase
MIILFMGPSGSGKDTQADIICVRSSFQSVSTGDLIRDISNGASSIQTFIRKALNDKFMTDDLTYGLLQLYLKYARGEDFIITGGVRRASQIKRLDNVVADIGLQVDHVFNFVLSDAVAIERLSNRLYCKVCKSNYNTKTKPPRIEEKCDRCGAILFKRDDDNDQSIKIRLEEFYKSNDEIIGEYTKRGIVTHLDASKSIDVIAEEIRIILDEIIHKDETIKED